MSILDFAENFITREGPVYLKLKSSWKHYLVNIAEVGYQ